MEIPWGDQKILVEKSFEVDLLLLRDNKISSSLFSMMTDTQGIRFMISVPLWKQPQF